MLGSAIVVLPVAHTGGRLKVQHLGEEQVFDFAPKSDHYVVDDAGVLQWAAWYGDCLHEVEEVTNGTRIAISYSVLYAGQLWEPENEAEGGEGEGERDEDSNTRARREAITGPPDVVRVAASCADAWGAFLAAVRMIREEGAVGILLAHTYPMLDLDPSRLKGLDQHLASLLMAEPTLRCSLYSVAGEMRKLYPPTDYPHRLLESPGTEA